MRNEKGQFIKGNQEGFQKGHRGFRTKESYREASKKISKALKIVFQEGRGHFFKKGNKIGVGKRYWFNKKRLEKTKQKISKSLEGKNCGKDHWNWQDGKSFEPYGLEFNNDLKEQIRKRDSYRCQECFRHQDELFKNTKAGLKPYKLFIHHIDYDKKNNNKSNLISLCMNCHSQTNYGREDWIKYFQEKNEFKK